MKHLKPEALSAVPLCVSMSSAWAPRENPYLGGVVRARASSHHRLRTEARLPEPGETIAGKYAVVRTLGEGGMGVVYEAVHVRLHQRLAIKVLRPDVPNFDEVLARFEREARATAQLRSLHTARVIDVDALPNGLPYIVMEYLDGVDLEVELESEGPLPIEQAVDIVQQVASAMTDAHAAGIVHRDLKPSNLFVCRIGERRVIKVLDFGISKFEGDGDARITAANAYIGTPYYAAPEQLRCASAADARCDVWSLGVILFELLCGHPPFIGSPTEVIAKVMVDPVPWPTDLRPDLPRDLARVIMHALKRDPRERFQSMRDLADALAPFGPTERTSTVIADMQKGRGLGRLGEILVAEGLIEPADLDRALVEQRRSGKLLGNVLLEMGLVAHADMLTALAKQQGIEVSPLAPSGIERDVAERGAATLPASAPSPRRHARRPLWIALAVGLPLGICAAVGLGVALKEGQSHAAQSSGLVALSRDALVQKVALTPAPAPQLDTRIAPIAPSFATNPAARPATGHAATSPHHATRFEPDTL
jgi:serine/threonine-protein kinase